MITIRVKNYIWLFTFCTYFCINRCMVGNTDSIICFKIKSFEIKKLCSEFKLIFCWNKNVIQSFFFNICSRFCCPVFESTNLLYNDCSKKLNNFTDIKKVFLYMKNSSFLVSQNEKDCFYWYQEFSFLPYVVKESFLLFCWK